MRGVVAAGHALTAEAGARALRDGGNAVDAALAAMMAAFAAEPQLTGFGAGGYLLVGTPDGEDVLLDFFVEAPGRGRDPDLRGELVEAVVHFGDVTQTFHCGPASCGTYGMAAGLQAAHDRFGSLPRARLAEDGIRLAREGVAVNAQQAYIADLLAPILRGFPEACQRFWPSGEPPREGDVVADDDLARALERFAAEGAAPFYTGDIAAAVVDWLDERGGMVTAEDLAAYAAVPRAPVRLRYRGREVLTNPPPSAGGILIALTLRQLDAEPGPPRVERLVAAMEAAQRLRTPQFLEDLSRPGFNPLGNTTHVSVLDADGMACSVTVTNGEGSGVCVPGTGVHLNNMMGEEDLSPSGFFTHPPGRRLPSMMAPTLVRRGGDVSIVVGSAGSNRIRSAILQVIVNAVDRGLEAQDAVAAPRVHWEGGIAYAEPGIDGEALEAAGYRVSHFSEPNLYFGGAQAVERDVVTGAITGGADPRRGGAVVVVE
jgi:gamma-glutamyltranspeptidase / glutathione hydrolase